MKLRPLGSIPGTNQTKPKTKMNESHTNAAGATYVVAQKVAGPTGGRFIVASQPHPAGGFMTSRQSQDWMTFEDHSMAVEWAARCKTLRVIRLADAPAWLA
jgi:hypothetical protein